MRLSSLAFLSAAAAVTLSSTPSFAQDADQQCPALPLSVSISCDDLASAGQYQTLAKSICETIRQPGSSTRLDELKPLGVVGAACVNKVCGIIVELPLTFPNITLG